MDNLDKHSLNWSDFMSYTLNAAVRLRKNYLEYLSKQRIASKRWRTNGNRVDKFPGFTTQGVLNDIQNMINEMNCELEQFTGRVISMSMYNDIVFPWNKCSGTRNLEKQGRWKIVHPFLP